MIIFRILSTEIRIGFSFLVMLTLLLLTLQNEYSYTIITACVLHECGHIAMLTVFGGKISKLAFNFLSIYIKPTWENPLSEWKKKIVYAAGCVLNLLLFALFVNTPLRLFAWANFCVAAFNLLPISGLDGGNLFRG